MYVGREHHDVKADQTHVMGQRHPRQAVVALGQPGRHDGSLAVGNDVAVSQYDTLGFARGTGRELDESNIIGLRLVWLAGPRDVIQVVNEECPRAKARKRLRLSDLGGECADAVERSALRVDVGVAELARDA